LELDEDSLISNDNKGNSFGFLCGSTLYDKTFPSKFKKQVNMLFNRRPDNVYGDYMRFLLLDSAHREGIDTFDVKYLHILQDLTNNADRKQAIGRATRMCGQKGLVFHPTKGWQLDVYVYDETVPVNNGAPIPISLQELYLQHSQIDMKLLTLAPELDKMIYMCAVDKTLTKNIHSLSIHERATPTATGSNGSNGSADAANGSMGGAKNWKDKKHRRKHRQQLPKPPQTKKTLADMSKYIAERFTKFAWPEMQMENLCGYAGPQSQDTHKTQEMGGAQEIIKFTPSQ
jgi:hypothetical protein